MVQNWVNRILSKVTVKPQSVPEPKPKFDFNRLVQYDLAYKKGKPEFNNLINQLSKKEREIIADQYRTLANAYMRRETDLPGVTADLEKAVILDPDNVTLKFELGLVYITRKLGKEAVSIFQQITRQQTPDSTFWCNLAEAYTLINDYDSALHSIAKAYKTERHPDQKQEILHFKQELEKEKLYFNKLITNKTRNPQNVTNIKKLANLYLLHGNYGLCLTEIDEVTKYAVPNDPELSLILAQCYLSLGKPDECIKSAYPLLTEKTVPLKPDTLCLILARAYEIKESWDESLNWCTRGIKTNPQNTELYFLRGSIYAKKNMYAEAIADYQIGKKLVDTTTP